MKTWYSALGALLLLAVASARRADQDFEFDDDASQQGRRPRRYIYDPHNPLCNTLTCARREVCVLRDAFTALCANKKEILRRGDTLVAARSGSSDEEDVFYDAAPSSDHDDSAPVPAVPAASASDSDVTKPERCVGCGRRRGGGADSFLCGSDNRTYSSLCRLDLHNCVRRPRRPVTLACRGFCPCASRNNAAYDVDSEGWNEDETAYNEVWNDSPRPHQKHRRPGKGEIEPNDSSPGCELERMADRLLDWFSVLMDVAGAAPPPRTKFPRDCKPEVRWMFEHLDTDGDGLLSQSNLYALRHDEREKCIRPFLLTCGAGGGGLGRAAWCGCLRRAARPCQALARAHPRRASGAYVPACDARGFYRPRQCHPALGVCWCVTPHGQELPGTRTKGAPACPGEKATTHGTVEAAGVPADDEDADADADADADSGSGGGAPEPELRF